MAANLEAKVKTDTLESCMTCSICNKLFREATTISECLHTFCKKCIYEKLSDEELDRCPQCDTYLGCSPLEKLRPDHYWQELREKIFPSKRKKVMEPEVPSSCCAPARRKERSLSSLVVSTPKVSAQTTKTGRRSKAATRKSSALRSGVFAEKTPTKEDSSLDDRLESSSSGGTLNKFTQNAKQDSSAAEPSSRPVPNKETENESEPCNEKVDMWKPLNCLVEAANKSKSSKCNVQGSAGKSETPHVPDGEGHIRKSKVKERGGKSKVRDDKNCTDPLPLESEKPRKSRRTRKRAVGESGISPQAVIDAAPKELERNSPIWFSLLASEDQKGDATLPQISASYLRIKDGDIPVSFIQKYLMKKLDLASEDEVEIRCMGHVILPTLQLNNLVDLWVQTSTTSQTVPAKIGCSAKDFVMVLAYSRKIS